MAVQGSSNENFTEYKKYLGLENFKITNINPEDSQKYLSKNSDGIPQIRIDFLVNNDPSEGEPSIKGNLSFFVSKEYKESKTGKFLFTNTKGQFAYLPEEKIPENMSWFSSEGIRKAYNGEDTLMSFIRNFANVGKEDNCSLDNPKALFTGNVSELKKIVSSFPNNKIKLLCTIREASKEDGTISYYQSFYNRKTERPYSTDFSYLRDDLENWKNMGGGSNMILPDFPYVLKEWKGVVPDEEELSPDKIPW